MEEAVRRVTSFPAEQIGLTDVGRIAEGMWADLVLLDPATVADNTTPERPDAAPTGVEAVIVSGRTDCIRGALRSGPATLRTRPETTSYFENRINRMDETYGRILIETYRMYKDNPINPDNLVNPVKDEIAFGRLPRSTLVALELRNGG